MESQIKCANNCEYLIEAKSTDECFTSSSLELHESRDANQLLTFFPEEVWLMILVDKTGAKSKAGTDRRTNCSLASPYFRKLLLKQRKFFLFPKVLDSLATWLGNGNRKVVPSDDSSSYEECSSSESSSSEDDDGHFEDERSSDDSYCAIGRCATKKSVFKLTDILKFQEVCSEWNQAFQQFYLGTQQYTSIQHDQKELTPNLGGITMSMREHNLSRIPPPFLSHFDAAIGDYGNFIKVNPFHRRSISFKDAALGPARALGRHQEMVREAMSRILEKYGDDFWHCSLDLQDQNLTRMAFYRQLRDWLIFMPNLKTFKLNCSKVSRNALREESLEALCAAFTQHPLPGMRNLKFMSVSFLTPAEIFNEIVRRCGGGLTQLVIIRGNRVVNEVYNDICSEAHVLPQLKELSIYFQSVEQFEELENSVIAAQWKLEKIYCLFDPGADFVEWSRVFQMISNKWAGSLTNLVLQMPVAQTEDDKKFCLEASLVSTAVQLLCLKRVKLIVKSPCCLDFLLPSAKTLESIEVIADYNVNEEKGKEYYELVKRQQQVKFLGFEKSKRRFAPTILEKFPKLIFLQIVSSLGNPKKRDIELSFRQMYRFSIYNEGEIKSEDREEYSWDISNCGLLK